MTLWPSGTCGSGSGGSSRSVCAGRAEAGTAGDAMRNRVCSVSSGWLLVAGTVTGISYCSKGGAGTLVGRCGMSSSPETAIHPRAARVAVRSAKGPRSAQAVLNARSRAALTALPDCAGEAEAGTQRREQSPDLGHQLRRGVRRRAEVDVASGSRHLELVQRGEGRMRQEAVGPAARHREICESVAELLVLLGREPAVGF